MLIAKFSCHLNVLRSSKVCFQILNSSHMCLMSFKILSTALPSSSSNTPEQTRFSTLIFQIFNPLTSLTSLILLREEMNLSLGKSAGEEFERI